ncbi:GNAT family N-acetyltransferase [Kribbella sp. CA-253562]|uniref:GNAT family N-acetyltransferase n=1 Tax=Kribbella sp. CA-253562 TaxID=3239942 RepID=UPI003D8A6D29
MDDLIRRWQYGWGLCRGLSPAVDRRTALDVTLGLPDRHRELFTLPGAALTPWIDETLRAARPTWLTVTTQEPDEVAAELQSAGLRLFAERKLLMTTDLREHPTRTTPYDVLTTTEGALERVRVLAGEEAARGMAAVVGDDAVMHDVHTSTPFRRQGLGSVVMGVLAERAVARQATTGLLMASSDGAALYRKLGWVPQATMLTARAA